MENTVAIVDNNTVLDFTLQLTEFVWDAVKIALPLGNQRSPFKRLLKHQAVESWSTIRAVKILRHDGVEDLQLPPLRCASCLLGQSLL
jgi:hypothetical protein